MLSRMLRIIKEQEMPAARFVAETKVCATRPGLPSSAIGFRQERGLPMAP